MSLSNYVPLAFEFLSGALTVIGVDHYRKKDKFNAKFSFACAAGLMIAGIAEMPNSSPAIPVAPVSSHLKLDKG